MLDNLVNSSSYIEGDCFASLAMTLMKKGSSLPLTLVYENAARP